MNKLLKVFYDSIWKMPREIHIKELDNGYVLNQHFYATLPELMQALEKSLKRYFDED